MLREFGLFVIISLLFASLTLFHLPFLTPHQTTCAYGFSIVKGDWGLSEAILLRRNLNVEISADIKMTAYNVPQVDQAILFVIPEKEYLRKEKIIYNLEREEVLKLLKKISIRAEPARRTAPQSLEVVIQDLALEESLILIAYLEGDFSSTPGVSQNITPAPPPSVPPPPPLYFNACFNIKAKVKIGGEQLARVIDVAVIGLALFVLGDLRSEDSWLRRLKRYSSVVKPSKPKRK